MILQANGVYYCVSEECKDYVYSSMSLTKESCFCTVTEVEGFNKKWCVKGKQLKIELANFRKAKLRINP